MPKFREITGQFVGYIPDSIDADTVPDRAPMNGRVTFTPVFTGGVIAFPELSPPEFAHPRTIHAKIVDGFVQVEVNEGEGDDEQIVLQPLSLMVTVDDEASQVWSWRAEFSEILIGASDEYVQIPSWSFRVPDGTGPVDLTELVPLKSTGTVDVTKGPRGAGLENITAVDGQLVFVYTDGEETTVPIPEAVQGPQGEPGPAGADGEQGPEGPQGPAGEIPDLLVGNITDATPTGKNLMLAATEGAARDALGLAAGATAINGSLSELNNGTSNSPRVWTPANLASYTTGRLSEYPTQEDIAEAENSIRQDGSLHPNPAGQGLNYMDYFTSWDAYAETNGAWTQGFTINEDTEEIYVSAYLDNAQWVECRNYDGSLKWRTDDIELPGNIAYSEGCPFYYNDSDQLCFILRIDPGGYVRTYNSVTKALSAAMPVLGVSKLFSDHKYFYCAEAAPDRAILTAVYVYSLESIKNGTPVLVNEVQLDQFGPLAQDNKPQGLAVKDGYIYLSAGKRDANDDTTGRLDLRVYNATGRIVSAVVLNKADYRRVLAEQKRPSDTIPNEVSFENEGVFPLRDGRIATMNHLHRYVYITFHGVGSTAKVETDPVPLSNSSGWVDLELADGIEAYSSTQVPQYRREGAIVFLRGAYKGVSSISGSENLALLPVGLRPAQNMNFLMKSNGDAYWRCDVGNNGYIKIVNYSAGEISASSWLPAALSFVIG